MFDLGKFYALTMRDGQGRSEEYGWRAVGSNGVVVTFERNGVQRIINTSSQDFIEAKLMSDQSGERPLLELPSEPFFLS